MQEDEQQSEEIEEETPVIVERVILARDHRSKRIIKRPIFKCCGGR